jgi:regulator of replication initiation timing
MAQSNAAAVEVMNNSTEVADLKAQIIALEAKMAALEEKNATLAAENSALKSENTSVKQDIKVVEQYEGIDFQAIVDEVRAKDGQDYYDKIVKDLKIDDYSKHDLVKAYMDDQNATPIVDFETGEIHMPESRVELWFRSHPEVNRKDITEA